MKKSRFSTSCFVFVVAARVFAVKIERLELEKSRNKLQRTQKMKKSRAIDFDFVFCFFVVAARVFVVEQFRIRRWKANGKTNLIISKNLKIERLEPEKSRNKLQRTQKMKKSRAIVFNSTLCFLFAIS